MPDYDVIVVGAGNAAFAAAVSARENGARVVALEKAPPAMRGGNTYWSGAILRFAFDDPQEIAPLLPDIEARFEDFYSGINPYPKAQYIADLGRYVQRARLTANIEHGWSVDPSVAIIFGTLRERGWLVPRGRNRCGNFANVRHTWPHSCKYSLFDESTWPWV